MISLSSELEISASACSQAAGGASFPKKIGTPLFVLLRDAVFENWGSAGVFSMLAYILLASCIRLTACSTLRKWDVGRAAGNYDVKISFPSLLVELIE